MSQKSSGRSTDEGEGPVGENRRLDEDLDRRVLDALAANDTDKLLEIPEDRYQSGSSEIKNWIPLSAIMADLDLDMTLVDYVPCYRSEAGTGNAMGFVYWQ